MEDKWVSIHSSSSVLTPAADPALTLMAGWTGASFQAARPGTAIVTASRYPCGTVSPRAPKMVCGVIIGYRVDVLVVS
jgi:hypothetical protein